METKPKTIQIPKPDEDGLCNADCLILPTCTYYQAKEVLHENYCSPGPGCPWHDGGKDE